MSWPPRGSFATCFQSFTVSLLMGPSLELRISRRRDAERGTAQLRAWAALFARGPERPQRSAAHCRVHSWDPAQRAGAIPGVRAAGRAGRLAAAGSVVHGRLFSRLSAPGKAWQGGAGRSVAARAERAPEHAIQSAGMGDVRVRTFGWRAVC